MTWERTKLRNIKEKLDKVFLEGLSERQRGTSARVSRTEQPLARPFPIATNGPLWAIRSD